MTDGSRDSHCQPWKDQRVVQESRRRGSRVFSQKEGGRSHVLERLSWMEPRSAWPSLMLGTGSRCCPERDVLGVYGYIPEVLLVL